MDTNNTSHAQQYQQYKGVRANSRNFKPIVGPCSHDDFVYWAAMNDVNIVSVNDYGVIYEYAFIVDGRKKWGKAYQASTNSNTNEPLYMYIAETVQNIRERIDGDER